MKKKEKDFLLEKANECMKDVAEGTLAIKGKTSEGKKAKEHKKVSLSSLMSRCNLSSSDLQHPSSCAIPAEIYCRCQWCKQQSTAICSQGWSSGSKTSKGQLLWGRCDVCQYCFMPANDKM